MKYPWKWCDNINPFIFATKKEKFSFFFFMDHKTFNVVFIFFVSLLNFLFSIFIFIDLHFVTTTPSKQPPNTWKIRWSVIHIYLWTIKVSNEFRMTKEQQQQKKSKIKDIFFCSCWCPLCPVCVCVFQSRFDTDNQQQQRKNGSRHITTIYWIQMKSERIYFYLRVKSEWERERERDRQRERKWNEEIYGHVKREKKDQYKAGIRYFLSYFGMNIFVLCLHITKTEYISDYNDNDVVWWWLYLQVDPKQN